MGSRIFSFNGWIVEPELNTVTPPGEDPIRIEGKVMQVLVVLIDHAGHVVPKETIIQKVWPGTFVSDDSLFRCVRELRKTFHDDPKFPKFIQTFPKKGYRAVGEIGEPSRELPGRVPVGGQMRPVVATLCLALVLVAVAWLYRTDSDGGAGSFHSHIDSIAVLPFSPVGGEADLGDLATGIADSVAFSLSQNSGLRVISNTASFLYQDTAEQPAKVARALGAKVLLGGRISQVEDGLAVSAELICQGSEIIWGKQYRTSRHQILQLNERIAGDLSQALGLAPEETVSRHLSRFYTDNTEAYDLYLRGRFHSAKTTHQGFQKGIEFFQKAIALEPSYALAYSGLADAYTQLGFFNIEAPEMVFPKARAAALRALELDATLAEAHTSLAGLTQVESLDWDLARQQFERAISLDPAYPVARHWYGLLHLVPRGDFMGAMEQIEQAEGLTPLSPGVSASLGLVFYLAEHFEEAIEQQQRTIEIAPDYSQAWVLMGLAQFEIGEAAESIRSLEKAITLSDEQPFALAGLAGTLARLGREEEARQILARLLAMAQERSVMPYDLATVYTALGDLEEAFAWLERSRLRHGYGLTLIKVDPRLKRLRGLSRFESFLESLGLSPSLTLPGA